MARHAVDPVPQANGEGRRAATRRRRRLGEILVEAGLLTPERLEEALERQKRTGERLGKVLLEMGIASEAEVARAVASQLGLEYLDLTQVLPDEQAMLVLPEHMARRYQVIPLRLADGKLTLGMVDPLDVLALDDVRRHTPDEEMGLDRLRQLVDEAPVVRLVNQIILQAIRQRASDIHIEPQESRMRVRYRIDGILYNVMTPPRDIQAAVISRIKIMAEIDIAERRRPQDGRIAFKVDEREYDLRVNTMPTVFGEKVVMRILDKSAMMVGIDKIGLLPDTHRRFEQMMGKPYGIILLTGPTGSGKSTTLYSMLNRLNSTERNIITIEDPVEYHLPGINQVQVNPKAGLTFATGLRAFLRQDPDIIMVGEIRDEETARIAIHAALTGHLVLSTLHTNDAPGAVTRLVDMGIESFLVASSIIGVVAQRLVRVLCDRCKEAYSAPPDLL